jgi:hypothetical protein
MALTNWPSKTCGKCETTTAEDLPQYICESCGKMGCYLCMGDLNVDGDGNIDKCKECLMPELAKIMQLGNAALRA